MLNFKNLLKSLGAVSSIPVSPTTQKGNLGESLALHHLRRTTSFQLLARNWRSGPYEIDLIGREGPCLVFVEVRSRKWYAKVSGYHSIRKKKKLSMRRAAFRYMRSLPQKPRTYRYDVVEVGLQDSKARFIRHYRNVSIFK